MMVYVKFLWIGPACQVFAGKISLLIMRCFYSVNIRTIFTMNSAFLFSQKDVLSTLQQSKMVNKFQYNSDDDYSKDYSKVRDTC